MSNEAQKPLQEMRLFDLEGRRLYFTADERRAFLAAASTMPRETRSFCGVLHHTGCRISEALAITAPRIDLSGRAIVFETLKKRRKGIFRAVPCPAEFLDDLDIIHGLRQVQARGGRKPDRLWPWSRMTGYTRVMEVIKAAGIPDGPHASPKGLRHGFGVNAVVKGVPLSTLQKWLGHAQLSTTAIYANAIGQEEQDIAARMWS